MLLNIFFLLRWLTCLVPFHIIYTKRSLFLWVYDLIFYNGKCDTLCRYSFEKLKVSRKWFFVFVTCLFMFGFWTWISFFRFLCKLKEAELLEPLMPTIRSCLEHRHSYVRRNAVMAIFTIYKNFDFLIPDAPELIANFLDGEQVSVSL